MDKFLLFVCQYISPVLLTLFLIWRFKGKLDWIFPTTVISVLGFTYLPDISFSKWQSGSNELKKEIIRLCKMDRGEIQELMKRRGIEGTKNQSGILVYPAKQQGDYKKFYLKKDMRFIIAFEHPHEYDEFCASADSLMVRKGKIVGCQKDTAYQLAQDCFVCKNGYDDKLERFVLKVSRNLNFTTPNNPKPKPVPKKEDKIKNISPVVAIPGIEELYKYSPPPQKIYQPPPIKKEKKEKEPEGKTIEVF